MCLTIYEPGWFGRLLPEHLSLFGFLPRYIIQTSWGNVAAPKGVIPLFKVFATIIIVFLILIIVRIRTITLIASLYISSISLSLVIESLFYLTKFVGLFYSCRVF